MFARRYAELDLTVGLVVGADACLVIDAGGDASQGAELAAAVREITPHPWTMVLTHSHFDHSFGVSAFLPAQVWAHEGCRADLVATGQRRRQVWERRYREQGRPDIADRIAEVELIFPGHLVTDRAELVVGGRRVVLAHFGPAHSDHDLVVHVPDVAVVFAGDLVEHGAPPSFADAHPRGWPAALDAILALGPEIVVPGHGDPVDPAFVVAQRAELAAVAELCADVAAGEITEADALYRSPYPEAVTATALSRPT